MAALRQMVTFPNFHEGFSFDILLAVSRASPNDWFAHFRLLQPRISDLHATAATGDRNALREFAKAARRFGSRFAGVVPTTAIVEQLPRLIISGDYSRIYETGSWLVTSLFVGGNAPLEIDKDRVDFANSSENVHIPVIAKEPIRATEMIWSSSNYRAFLRLESSCYREHLDSRMDADPLESAPDYRDEATDLLIHLNSPLMNSIYGRRDVEQNL